MASWYLLDRGFLGLFCLTFLLICLCFARTTWFAFWLLGCLLLCDSSETRGRWRFGRANLIQFDACLRLLTICSPFALVSGLLSAARYFFFFDALVLSILCNLYLQIFPWSTPASLHFTPFAHGLRRVFILAGSFCLHLILGRLLFQLLLLLLQSLCLLLPLFGLS